MKAITIHQPWASLIAIGAKRFETRSWRTHYRGPIAIHAAKKIDHQATLMVARDHPHIWRQISPLQTGCVIAIADLTNCYEIECYKDRVELVLNHGDYGEYVDIDGMEMGGQEERFGWYADGRYAWELSNVRLIEPIPAKGRQGLWNWNPPEDWKCVVDLARMRANAKTNLEPFGLRTGTCGATICGSNTSVGDSIRFRCKLMGLIAAMGGAKCELHRARYPYRADPRADR